MPSLHPKHGPLDTFAVRLQRASIEWPDPVRRAAERVLDDLERDERPMAQDLVWCLHQALHNAPAPPTDAAFPVARPGSKADAIERAERFCAWIGIPSDAIRPDDIHPSAAGTWRWFFPRKRA